MGRTGGAIVARGSGALIVAPAIPCTGESAPRQGFVSRVPIGDAAQYYGTTPPGVLERLKTLDPRQQYFYYPVDCTPGTLTEENRRDGITDATKVHAELVRYAPGGAAGTPSVMKPMTAAQRRHLKAAVTLLHANGIVHGDLHPANVVFAEDGLPRLIDWQGATFLADLGPKGDRAKRDDWESLAMPLHGSRRATRRRKRRSSRRLTRTSASGRA